MKQLIGIKVETVSTEPDGFKKCLTWNSELHVRVDDMEEDEAEAAKCCPLLTVRARVVAWVGMLGTSISGHN